ncbi:MAG: hypothetical protein KDE58_14110, partial [Caldilineaceae bacterium]|nr:hypothetical protein [Caldilineaceae bacterium]
EGIRLDLVPNPDIVAGLAARKGDRVVVGFALQDAAEGFEAAIRRGREKLIGKGLDLVVVNLHDAIDDDRSEVVLCFADGRDEHLPRQDKQSTAIRIVAIATDLFERKGAA